MTPSNRCSTSQRNPQPTVEFPSRRSGSKREFWPPGERRSAKTKAPGGWLRSGLQSSSRVWRCSGAWPLVGPPYAVCAKQPPRRSRSGPWSIPQFDLPSTHEYCHPTEVDAFSDVFHWRSDWCRNFRGRVLAVSTAAWHAQRDRDRQTHSRRSPFRTSYYRRTGASNHADPRPARSGT